MSLAEIVDRNRAAEWMANHLHGAARVAWILGSFFASRPFASGPPPVVWN